MGSYPVLERIDFNGKFYEPGKKNVTIDDDELAGELIELGVIGKKVAAAAAQPPAAIVPGTETVEQLVKLGKTKLVALAKAEEVSVPAGAGAPAIADAVFAARAAKAAAAAASVQA